MPTQLARLYRFFRHEEKEDTTPIWNVASVPYDIDFRTYRVMYNDNVNCNLNCDYEITIPLSKSWKKELGPFVQLFVKVLGEKAYDNQFRIACMDMAHEDPWLEEYLSEACSILTKTHPSPYT